MVQKFKKLSLLLGIIVFTGNAYCQVSSDTASIISEFNKVMSFAVEPYLFYKTEMNATSSPVLEEKDTMLLHGVFYKCHTSLYYGNEREEMYVEDGFLIQVSHVRKSIWISKIDTATIGKMNLMPLDNILAIKKMMTGYTIRKTSDSNISRIDFMPKYEDGYSPETSTSITFEYNKETQLPKNIQIDIHTNLEVNDEMISNYNASGINVTSLIKLVDGKKYMIKDQKVILNFLAITKTKEGVQQMPSYKDKIVYDKVKNEFKVKGNYQGYEITKTF